MADYQFGSTETAHHVKPLPIYAHLEPHYMAVYNGHGAPSAVIANPEDMFFITRGRPSSSIMMLPLL